MGHPLASALGIQNVIEGRRSRQSKAEAPDTPAGWDSVPPEPRLLDLRQAGAYTGTSAWTIRAAVEAGYIPRVELPNPYTRDGRSLRRILIDRQDLDAWIDRHKER